jgi:hypothetical protein
MFEKHLNAQHKEDDLHVQALSNPELAAQIAALKLVMNTNLRDKLQLLDNENKGKVEYLKTIINQKNIQMQLKKVLSDLQLPLGPHILGLMAQPGLKGRYKS